MTDQPENKNFYFQGIWFDTSEEMFKYAKKWQDEILDPETAQRLFGVLLNDCITNVFMRNLHLKNKDFNCILEKLFMEFIKEIEKGV